MTSTLTSPGRPATRPVDLPENAGRAALGIAIVLTAQLMFILDATVLTSATMAALAGLTGLVALATRRRRTEVALAA